MRLSHEAWRQLRPFFTIGTGVEFDYHGRHRVGSLETIGEGPQGAFFTIRHADGVFKSYSLAKVEGLSVYSQTSSPSGTRA
ncbi:MAG: hypothetical protein H0T47_17450 [Planctomycetaceae bacterium]|nr:hypothetical protein [Planctomycetaceae bacterium]